MYKSMGKPGRIFFVKSKEHVGKLNMRHCLVAPEKTRGVSYTDAMNVKKAGFDFYELDLRAIKIRLGRGGSVS